MNVVLKLKKKDILDVMDERLESILAELASGGMQDEDITESVITAIEANFKLDSIGRTLLEEVAGQRVRSWRKNRGLWQYLSNTDQQEMFAREVGNALLHVGKRTLMVTHANLDVLEVKERHLIDNNMAQQTAWIRNMNWVKEAKVRLHGDRTSVMGDVLD